VLEGQDSARLIAAAGGTLLVPPFDVMESRRMALFDDSRRGLESQALSGYP
jgi:hypothetical protein